MTKAGTLALLATSLVFSAAPSFAQTLRTELETVKGLGAIDRTTQAQDVTIKEDGYDRMTVPVRLSGSGPYRFLVDAGADRTAISRQLASQLKLVPGTALSLHSVSGVSTVPTAMVPSLQLLRKDVKVDDAPLLDAKDIGADGILGIDSLRSQRIMFDFEKNMMSVVPSGLVSRENSDPDTIVITAKARKGRLIFTRAVANGSAATVVIDTGSQFSIGNAALRKALAGSGQLAGAQLVDLYSVTGGKVSGESMIIKKLVVGQITLTDLVIIFADAHTFNQLDLNRKPALLLGMNAMRAFKKVSIDFAQRKLRVVLPEESSLPVRMASR